MIHHMNPRTFDLFSEGLNNLKPILKQLATISNVVWMVQPRLPTVGNILFSVHLPHYNKEAKKILK